MRTRSGRRYALQGRRYHDPYANIRSRGRDRAVNVHIRNNNKVTEYGAMSDDEEEVSVPMADEILKVEEIDFLVESNTKEHRTDEYDIVSTENGKKNIVIRRGKTFKFAVKFNRDFNSEEDDLKLIFQIGDNPRESKGTLVHLLVSDEDIAGEWGAELESSESNKCVFSVITPPNCFVGKWRFKVDVVQKGEEVDDIFRYNHKNPIYILFNPWCKDDSTFMPNKSAKGPDENLLDEYVMNETGKIYVGSVRHLSSCPWNFGQFEGDVLDCAMALMEEMPPTACGDPVKVARKLTALINSSDDEGVLTGNWSGDYSGGKSPCSWTGSVAILEEWYKTRTPVCFGQCWVFSGVMTSVLRSLGIPARSVTNFASAHDTDGSVTIDTHFNENGDVMEDMNDDSIWNFHVWNEAYFSRNDLPKGYGGWQACDATPQEVSDGRFCCGPASIRAIKNGEIHLLHDAPFIFAEVNADKIYWEVSKKGKMSNICIKPNSIGKYISSKKPGQSLSNIYGKWDPDRHDLTLNYKYQEGSKEERAAVLRANQLCSTRKDAYGCQEEYDVEFEIVEYDELTYGRTFDVCLKIRNTCKQKRSVSGKLSCSSMYYTGVHAHLIKSQPFQVQVKGKGDTTVKMVVEWADYGHKIVQHCMLKSSVLCKVDDTNQVYASQDDFRLQKPDLEIKAPAKAKRNEKWPLDISFKNPLPLLLTECELTVDGPGLQKAITLRQPSIAAHGTFTAHFDMIPRKIGFRNAILNFTSNELEGIKGVASVQIT